MLAIFGLIIVVGFMTLIMTKKATPFTALALVPLLVGIITGLISRTEYSASDIAKFALAGLTGNSSLDHPVSGIAGTAIMLLFAILYFGLMLTAGLFDPVVAFILRIVKGDPLKVMVGTAVLALAVSVDGDGSTTTLVVCSALIPVYKQLKMKMMDLAVIIILGNSIMNLLPWGGPTARIISALGVDEGVLLRKIVPGMLIASVWVIAVAFIRGRAERKRLGVVTQTEADIAEVRAQQHATDAELSRPKMIWFNLALTVVMLVILIFGDIWIIPKVNAAVIFAVGLAIAMTINYRSLKNQREIIEKYGSSALHVVIMVLGAGIFMGILIGTGMSDAMGRALADWMPDFLGSHWAIVTAVVSAPGTFLLSNDAFYYGVLPVLNEVGLKNGFEAMDMAVASTVGQAFHLLSPLVGFIYLLLHLTGVDMGAWQRKTAKWALGTFAIFLLSILTFGGVPA
ncbi:MAG: citrate:proton symporter [Propionibacteriaceae bacterium]|jgi:CitMHS family citrate-Mg2+:H+ or citrate-Ca2+:H+ symporter|nr:citrate:proton symporter [Propionibacteriaceae bacterium]